VAPVNSKGSNVADRPVKSLIMAAGMSTRMKSARSKVLHEVCGRKILEYVLEACRGAGIRQQIVLVGAMREQVRQAFADANDITWVVQEPQLGTGHAALMAREALKGFTGDLVVLVGDAPMIRPETVRTLIETHRREGAAMTMVTALLDDPKWFGRIVRDASGKLLRIVEAKDASPQERAIREVNPAYYAFHWPALNEVLGRITHQNAKGEYYLTDAVELLIASGRKAVAVAAAQPEEVEAVNSRRDLAHVTALMRRRILDGLMAEGVTIEDPATTFIDVGVTIGQDTVVHPCSVIRGPATIGKNCRVGPMAHLRPGTVLEDGAEVGAFVELKKARLGAGARARHLSYLGDCTVGPRTNVGCGTITANSDGRGRHFETQVGADVRLGAGTILVAPTAVGDGGETGAGAVVTHAHPVPKGETYVGVPARALKGSPKSKSKSPKAKVQGPKSTAKKPVRRR
jgi:bifunctional UDP-N-acetylglucosamine pyrophosphorylase / glucosamine-1-phosphate N-acetyltransferase